MGCKILNLVNSSLLELKSSAIPAIKDSLGYITSANAAIDPVAPDNKNRHRPILKPLSKKLFKLFFEFFVKWNNKVYVPSNPNVFTKWSGTAIIRGEDEFKPTHS